MRITQEVRPRNERRMNMRVYEDYTWTRNLMAFGFACMAIGFVATSLIDKSLLDVAIALVCYIAAVWMVN